MINPDAPPAVSEPSADSPTRHAEDQQAQRNLQASINQAIKNAKKLRARVTSEKRHRAEMVLQSLEVAELWLTKLVGGPVDSRPGED